MGVAQVQRRAGRRPQRARAISYLSGRHERERDAALPLEDDDDDDDDDWLVGLPTAETQPTQPI